MRQRVYRWLIAIFGGWAFLSLPSLVALVPSAIHSGDLLLSVLSLIGFALLPVSVIGLWHFRLWGFICLVLGFLIVLALHPHAVYLHAACIVVTLVRYYFPRHERNAL